MRRPMTPEAIAATEAAKAKAETRESKAEQARMDAFAPKDPQPAPRPLTPPTE